MQQWRSRLQIVKDMTAATGVVCSESNPTIQLILTVVLVVWLEKTTNVTILLHCEHDIVHHCDIALGPNPLTRAQGLQASRFTK